MSKYAAQAVIQRNSKELEGVTLSDFLPKVYFLLKDRIEKYAGFDIIDLMISHPEEFGLNMYKLNVSGLYPTFRVM